MSKSKPTLIYGAFFCGCHAGEKITEGAVSAALSNSGFFFTGIRNIVLEYQDFKEDFKKILRLPSDASSPEINAELQRTVGRLSSLELVSLEQKSTYMLYLTYDIVNLTLQPAPMIACSSPPANIVDLTVPMSLFDRIRAIEESDFSEWRKFFKLCNMPFIPPVLHLAKELCENGGTCNLACCNHNDDDDEDDE